MKVDRPGQQPPGSAPPVPPTPVPPVPPALVPPVPVPPVPPVPVPPVLVPPAPLPPVAPAPPLPPVPLPPAATPPLPPVVAAPAPPDPPLVPPEPAGAPPLALELPPEAPPSPSPAEQAMKGRVRHDSAQNRCRNVFISMVCSTDRRRVQAKVCAGDRPGELLGHASVGTKAKTCRLAVTRRNADPSADPELSCGAQRVARGLRGPDAAPRYSSPGIRNSRPRCPAKN